MKLNWREFYDIGREHVYDPDAQPLVRLFAWACGPISLHPHVSAGHIIRAIQDISLPPNARVLDGGCGRALVLFWLAKRYPLYSLLGIEIEEEKVIRNRDIAMSLGINDRLSFVHSDISKISFDEDIYDLIISLDVLEHIVADVEVLQSFYRALKPHGWMVLHLPLRHQLQRRSFPVFRNHLVGDHVRDEYLPQEIEAKLKRAGFQMVNLCYGFGTVGELAFELNNLFWTIPWLRAIIAILLYPLTWVLALWDVNKQHREGNSMIIIAQRPL